MDYIATMQTLEILLASLTTEEGKVEIRKAIELITPGYKEECERMYAWYHEECEAAYAAEQAAMEE